MSRTVAIVRMVSINDPRIIAVCGGQLECRDVPRPSSSPYEGSGLRVAVFSVSSVSAVLRVFSVCAVLSVSGVSAVFNVSGVSAVFNVSGVSAVLSVSSVVL